MAIKIKKKSKRKEVDASEEEGVTPSEQGEGTEEKGEEKEVSGALTFENELEREIEEGVVGTPDPFQRGAVESVDWASRHVSTIVGAVLIIIVLAGSSYFLLAYLEDRKTELSSELNPVFQANASLIKGSEDYKAIESANPQFKIPTFDSETAREEAILKTAELVTRDASDDPIVVPALLAEASANLKMGKSDKAVTNYQKILKISTDNNVNLIAKFGLSEAYTDQQKYDEALKELEDVEKSDTKVAKQLRLAKAKLYEAMGKKEEAKKLYNEILDDKSAGPAQSDIERRLANL